MTNQANTTEQPNTYTSDGITWHYNSNTAGEIILSLSKAINITDSTSIAAAQTTGNTTDLTLIKQNPRRAVYSLTNSGKSLYIKLFKSANLSEKAKIAARGNPAEQEAQWLNICRCNQLPVPSVIGHTSGKANMLITESLGSVAALDEIIREYSDFNPPTLYRDQLPDRLQHALAQTGSLVGNMHKAGLILPDLHGGNIMLDHNCQHAFLLDLQLMKRTMSANQQTIQKQPLIENTARLASEISICCGRAALEIFITGYLAALNNINSPNDFLPIIERAIDAWRLKFYTKRDKRCCRKNEFFAELELGNNFKAHVFLKNNRPMLFSAISQLKFTAEQWHSALEPIKNSRRLFSSKELTLKLGNNEITVDVEGGPPKVILNKWQYGHSLINRHIATPWPLAIVHNNSQAVLLTEKITDNTCMNYQNILIVKPSALGDVARMIPVLLALRDRYPKAKISWIIRPEFAELIRHNPALDEVILFDKKHLLKSGLKSISNIFAFAGALKQRKFDLVLDAQGLLRSGLMAWFTHASTRIGYRRARELAWLFYNKKVDTPQIQHSNLDCWQIGLAAGISENEPVFGVPVNPQAYSSAKSILNSNGINDNQQFAVLLSGGTAEAKIWPAVNFAQLADCIYRKYKIKSVLLGAGSRETAIGHTISDKITDKQAVINLIGQTSLDEMVAIICNSNIIIGNDSGPLHIAAAIPKPVVGIYGPTNPKMVGPYGQGDKIAEAGNEIPRIGRYSKNPAHKIDNISVSCVMEKVESLLINHP